MDGKARRGIEKFEGEVYQRTSVGSTGPTQKDEDGSGHVKFCYGRSTIYRV